MTMRIRRPRSLATAAAAAAMTALLAGCVPHFEKPDIEVVGVERQSVQLLEQHFLVHLRVTNPNDRAIPIEGVSYVVSINGSEVARGDTSQAVTIPARGSANVDLPLTTTLHTGVAQVLGLLSQGSDAFDYRVVGTARTGVAFFRTIPFDQHGTVRLRGG
jgi:LEA14-like dessication related protein